MQIIVDLPDDLIQRPNPAREALEALAISGYHFRVLSSYQARVLLGFSTHSELQRFLEERGIWDRGYDVDDHEEEIKAFDELERDGLIQTRRIQ